MKITIEAHGRIYSAELEDDIGALNEAVRGLLVAVGYHINTVDEYFPHWEENCDCNVKTYKYEIGNHFGI